LPEPAGCGDGLLDRSSAFDRQRSSWQERLPGGRTRWHASQRCEYHLPDRSVGHQPEHHWRARVLLIRRRSCARTGGWSDRDRCLHGRYRCVEPVIQSITSTEKSSAQALLFFFLCAVFDVPLSFRLRNSDAKRCVLLSESVRICVTFIT